MKRYYIILIISTSIALLLGSVAFVYSLIIKPYQEEKIFSDCLENANAEYERKQSEINKGIKTKEEKINEIKPEIEQEVNEIFSTLSPEPSKPSFRERWTETEVFGENEWDEWNKEFLKVKANAEEIEKPLRELEWDIRRLKEDLEIILVEKEGDEENCYRRYR